MTTNLSVSIGPAVDITRAQRLPLAMAAWSDGFIDPMESAPGRVRTWGSRAGSPTVALRVDGTLDDLLAFGNSQWGPILNPKATYDYDGSGKIVNLNLFGGTGYVKVRHTERWPGGDGSRFWSGLSLGYCDTIDGPFSDLGVIVTPTVPYNAVPTWANYIDIGGGAPIVLNGQFRVYFSDCAIAGQDIATPMGEPASTQYLCCASCPIAEVVAAAAAGQVPVFKKYFQGAFSEPALGGRSTPLDPANEPAIWGDVAWHTGLNLVIASGSRAHYSPQFKPSPCFVYASPDGLTDWSPKKTIETGVDASRIYCSMACAGNVGARTISGDVYFYYMVIPAGETFNDANMLLRRRKLVFGVGKPMRAIKIGTTSFRYTTELAADEVEFAGAFVYAPDTRTPYMVWDDEITNVRAMTQTEIDAIPAAKLPLTAFEAALVGEIAAATSFDNLKTRVAALVPSAALKR